MRYEHRGGEVIYRSVVVGIVVSGVVWFAGPAWAQDAEGPPEEVDSENEPPTYQAVIVAERLPEDEFQSARSLTVVDQEALSESAPRTIPEALWGTTGVFVQQTNHGGGSPILRGMIGPQNLILVDGVRLNNSVYRTGPLQYLNLIDPLSIARLEVLRGPGSVLYGSDAMGGVIQVRLLSGERNDDPTWAGQLLGRTGTANAERTVHGHIGLGGPRFTLLGGATFKAFGDLLGGSDVGRQPYSGYNNWSALANFGYRYITTRLRLRVDAVYLSGGIDRAGRTDKLHSGSLQFYDNIDHLLFARVGLTAPRLRSSAELTISYQHFFERKDALTLDDARLIQLRAVRDEITVNTLGLDLQVITRLYSERLRLRYGGMWYHDWVGSDRYRQQGESPFEPSIIGSYPDGSSYDAFGAFLLFDAFPIDLDGGHRLRLAGGYRFHGMASAAPAHAEISAAEARHLGHIFTAGAQYLYADIVNLSFNFSQGFRAPNLNESVMLGDTGKYFHIPNHDLQPERSDTFELLARVHFWRLTCAVTGYLSLVDDLIRREETSWEGQDEIDGKPVAWNINAGDGLIWGVEAQLGLEIGFGISILGNLTTTWGQGQLGDNDDVPLSRIPPLFGQLTLRYDWESPRRRYGLFAETFIRGAALQDRLSPEDVRDARIPEGGTPAWWTWSVRAGVRVPDVLVFRIAVENLLNETYRYHGSGVYGPGTSALFSLEFFL